MRETEDAILSALMVRMQAGDAVACRALLRAVAPIAGAMARRQGIAADRVDDVVQEVLITLHRARATYDPRRPFLPWLTAIAARRAVDAQRAWARSAGREVADEVALANAPDAERGAESALEAAGAAARLREAVAGLPPGQRQAVEELALKERSLAEVSAATGRSKVALKVNLHRAIAALRRSLGEASGE